MKPLYGLVTPTAGYSPWNIDELFRSTIQAIHPSFTLVCEYRCWELWTLVEQSAKLPEGDIIEVGVCRGGTGSLITRRARQCGLDCTVYLCDTFDGVVKAGEDDPQYQNGVHPAPRQHVDGLLRRFNLDKYRILEGIFPDQTAHLIPEDTRFRFCHIDVDVYQSAKDISDWVWDKMVVGGIVVYDDYGFSTCQGITKFVNEQLFEKDRIILHNLNGHAIVIKTR